MNTKTPPLPDRIQWHEGMLLSPQHFQLESGRVDALIAWHAIAGQPLGWGVRRLVIDESLLINGVVRVLQLEALMPDGMAVSYSVEDAGGLDLQLDLAEWAESFEQGELPIYLTVGSTRSMRGSGQPSRFRGVAAMPVDDEVSDALPVDIPRAAPNLALAAGDVPSSVFVHLRLMTVRKDNEVFKRGEYLPALMDVAAGSALHGRALALAAQMRSKAAFLAKQTASPSSRMEDRVAMLEQKARLSSLVLGLPPLEALLRAPSAQPFALYLALCAQLGPLAMLRPGAVPLLPPSWDHADPMAALGPVLQALEDFVAEVSQDWRTHLFGYDGEGFTLPMQPQWLGPRLVVGLRGQPERELAAWMAGAVIGSRTVWTSLSERRVLGAARKRIDEAPELGLRSGAGYTLFAIEVNDSFIVADQPLVISNANETNASQRPQEMVLFVQG
jgi:type VI secretion system protein ImpJ